MRRPPPPRRAGRARAARGRLRHVRRRPVLGDAGFRLLERGRVVGVTGWTDLHVGDPADDVA
ncbi:hypothetical protein GUG69_01470, partial [Xanthomonas citri pv. citri]|nr:hypothetical protein [Xanthomonas citri pv. citri]